MNLLYIFFIRAEFPVYLVGLEGIGPSTSVLSGQRSTTELQTHQINCTGAFYHWTNRPFISHINTKKIKPQAMSCGYKTADGHRYGPRSCCVWADPYSSVENERIFTSVAQLRQFPRSVCPHPWDFVALVALFPSFGGVIFSRTI